MTTALQQRLTSGNVRIGSYSGADTVLAFADPAHELQALNSGCGVFDLNWRAKIIVTGEDRVRWLNGMVTNNVRDLPLNHGNYNFLLNPQGRILADMYIYNRGEYLLLDTDRSQLEAVMKTLDHYIIMDDVELTDSSETLGAIGICGPKANGIVDQLFSAGNESSAQPEAAGPGKRAGPGAELFQGMLHRPGDCRAHPLPRAGTPQIHRI